MDYDEEEWTLIRILNKTSVGGGVRLIAGDDVMGYDRASSDTKRQNTAIGIARLLEQVTGILVRIDYYYTLDLKKNRARISAPASCGIVCRKHFSSTQPPNLRRSHRLSLLRARDRRSPTHPPPTNSKRDTNRIV